MSDAICSDTCLACLDLAKQVYLTTNFSKKGFGFVVCQPSDDPASLATMHHKMAGGKCKYLLPKSQLQL